MPSGDTLEVTIAHPVQGSRSFSVQSNQDVLKDLGGYSSERQVNGNLTGHKKLNAKPWKLSALQFEVDPDDGGIEFLQGVQDSPIDATITWTHISGASYTGDGSIEGDLQSNTNSGYVAIEMTGNGRLKKIG